MKHINKQKTVVMAMSGGVDSSVAAALLKAQGFKVIGITLKTWGYNEVPKHESGCCSLEAIYSARNVSVQLDIPHYTLDFTDRFNETVIENFISEYLDGKTPNPCVLCNKTIKWGAMLEKAESLGADFIATGHYARVKYSPDTGRYNVAVSADLNKDQSYALWQITQYGLSKTLFPLGGYTKPEIRKIASKLGLKSAELPDSQEICFVPNDNYRELLESRKPKLLNQLEGGQIVYKDTTIGEHKGYPYYTIGQRRGLGVSIGKPVYVNKIDPEKNLIYVDDEKSLYTKRFNVKDINLMLHERIENEIDAGVKIRYKDLQNPAKIKQISDDIIEVSFKTPRKAVTPGQSAVFYDGDNVIGGGIINEILE